jgi:hypothetical protein
MALRGYSDALRECYGGDDVLWSTMRIIIGYSVVYLIIGVTWCSHSRMVPSDGSVLALMNVKHE